MNKPITSWKKFLRAFGYRVNWQFAGEQKRKSKKEQQEALTFEKLQPREMLAVAAISPSFFRGGGGLGGPGGPSGSGPTVEFQVDSATQDEGTTMQVSLVLSEPLTHTVVVTGDINDGTATRSISGNNDFSTDETFSATFAPGATTASFDIELFADNQIDSSPTEDFSVTISDVTGAGIGTKNTFTGTIDDIDDSAGGSGGGAQAAQGGGGGGGSALSVEFVESQDIRAEGNTLFASIRVNGEIPRGVVVRSVEVEYVGGTATQGVDFTFQNQVVVLDGLGFGTVQIPHHTDQEIEGAEDYVLKITSVSATIGVNVEIGDNQFFRGIIVDPGSGEDPHPTAYVNFAQSAGSEEEGQSLNPLLKLSDPDLSNVTATVRYVPNSGSATEGTDFTFTTQTVSFNSFGYASLDVPHLTDSETESAEDYVLEIIAVTGPVEIGPNKLYTGTITDTGSGGSGSAFVQFVETAGSQIEGQTLIAVLELIGTDQTGVEANVEYVTNFGSATQGSDFNFLSQTVIFDDNGYAYATIPHLTDTIEEEDENYKIEIVSVDPTSISIGADSEFIGTILDSDYFVEIDLDVDSDNDGELGETEEDPIEHNPDYPGKIIAVNNRDRDGDNIVDSHDSWFNGTDADLTEIRVKIEDHQYVDLTNATLTFEYSFNDVDFIDGPIQRTQFPDPGNGTFRLWKGDRQDDENRMILRPDESYSPEELGFDPETSEVILYLEAINPTAVEDRHDEVKVKLSGPDITFTDIESDDDVLTRAIQIDLDVDTDNNNGLLEPDRNAKEEHLESWIIDITHEDPILDKVHGKLVAANNHDVDLDGVIDYNDTQIKSEFGQFNFTPIVLQAPDLIDLDYARIQFDFEDASSVQIDLDPASPHYQNRDRIRIWTIDGDKLRHFTLVQDGGNLIESGHKYSPLELGLSNELRTTTLFVEGFDDVHTQLIKTTFEIGEEIVAEAVPLTIVEDQLFVTVTEVDLDIDSDNDNGYGLPELNYQEDVIENSPQETGKIVFANRGDIDSDGVVDYSDWQTAGAQFNRVVLDIIDGVGNLPRKDDLTFHISYSAILPGSTPFNSEGKIRLWTKDASEARNPLNFEAGGDFLAPGVYHYNDLVDPIRFPNFDFGELYVEGVSPNDFIINADGTRTLRPELITVDAYLNGYRLPQVSDAVKLQVTALDADTDSDNNNGFNLPGRTIFEDVIEDDDDEAGKILRVNNGDADNDGTLDYLEPLTEPLTGVNFVPLVVELPIGTPINDPYENAYLVFDYEDYDPAQGDAPSSNGHIRIWKTNAPDRTAATGASDFITPGTQISVNQLGFNSETRTAVFYVEGVLPSEHMGQERVEIKLLTSDYLTKDVDAVRYTVRGSDHIEVTAPDRFARERDDSPSTPDDLAFFTFSKGENGSNERIDIVYKLTGSGVSAAEGGNRTLTINANEKRKSIYLIPATDNPANAQEIQLESLNSDSDVEWDRYVNVEIVSVTEVDSNGNPTQTQVTSSSSHTVRILDSDGVSATSNNNVDFDATGLTRSSTTAGPVSVDVREGTVQLLLDTPHGIYYNGANQLYPIINIQTKLPDYSLDSLSASVTFGFINGSSNSLDLSHLQPDDEIHLVVVASEEVARRYSTGRYAFDVNMVGQVAGGATYTRTFIGAKEHINTSIKGQGDEFGVGWRHAEVDRIYFDNGFTGRFTRAGLSPQSGLALIRGDNSSGFYTSTINNPNAISFVDPTAPADAPWNTSADGYLYADQSTSAPQGEELPRINWALQVSPNTPFQVFVEWTPDFDRASSARYEVKNAVPLGPYGRTVVQVDQRSTPADFEVNGKRWRSLGWFQQASSLNAVELELTAVNGDLLTVAGQAFVAEDFSYETPAESIGSTLEWGTTSVPVHRYAATGEEQLGSSFVLKTRNGQEYAFTSAGLHVATFDRHGNQTRFVYGDTGGDAWDDELIRVIRQGGLETEFRYDGNGYLSSIVNFRVDSQGSSIENTDLTTTYSITPSFLSERGGLLHRIELPDTGYVESKTPIYNFGYSAENLLDSIIQNTEQNQLETRISYRPTTHRVESITRIGENDRTTQYISLLEDAFFSTRVTGSDDLGHTPLPLSLVQASATVTDAKANAWTYQTNEFGQITASRKPTLQDGFRFVWTTERDSIGRITKLIEPRKYETTFDSADLPQRLENITSRETVFEYDEVGNYLKSITYAAGSAEQLVERWERQKLDGIGISFLAVTSHTAKDGLVTDFNYFGDSTNPSQMVENPNASGELSRSTTFSYTKNLDVLTDVNAIFALPSGMNRSSHVDGRLNRTVFWGEDAADPALYTGLVKSTSIETSENAELAQTTIYAYDIYRHLESSTAPGNVVTEYKHDRLGQLIETTYPVQSYIAVDSDNKISSADFNSNGIPNGVVDVATRKRDISHYDALGNLVLFKDHRNDPYAADYDLSDTSTETYASTQYKFNEFGELEEQRLPQQQSVSTAYPTVTRYIYNVNGNLQFEILEADGEERLTTYEYDKWNRQSRMTLPTPVYEGVDEGLIPAAAKVAPVVEYTYDTNGNLIYQTEASSTNGTELFYDAHDQLVAEVVTTAQGASIPDDAPVTKYLYDAEGRTQHVSVRTGRNAQGVDNTNSFSITSYEYDKLGRLNKTLEPTDQNAHRRETVLTYNLHDEVLTQTVNAKMFSTAEKPAGNADELKTRVESRYYDGIGRLIGINRTNSPTEGASTVYAYDDFGYVEAELVSSHFISSFNGVPKTLESLIDIASNTPNHIYQLTRYRNDQLGNVIAIVSPDSGEESLLTQNLFAPDGSVVSLYQHDLSGNVVRELKLFREERIADLENRSSPESVLSVAETGTRYDNLDRVWYNFNTADELGQRPATKTLYNGHGYIDQVIGHDGAVLSDIDYDNLGRLYRSSSYDGRGGAITTHQFMDGDGNILRKVDPSGWYTDYAFDFANRSTETVEYIADAGIDFVPGERNVDRHSATTTSSYYPDGLVKSVNQERPHYLEETNPSTGNIYDADSQNYSYDWHGNLLSQEEKRWVLDSNDSMVYETTTTSFKRDGFGNLVLTKNASGEDAWFTYNANGKIWAEESDNTQVRHFSYDQFGRLEKITYDGNLAFQSDRYIEFEYTSTGWLTSEKAVRTDLDIRRNEFSYTSLGEILTADTYLALPTEVEDWVSRYTYQYDSGRKLQYFIQEYAYLDGSVETLVTNDSHSLKRTENVSFLENGSSNATPRGIADREFQFDNHGRLRRLTQSGDAVSHQRVSHHYDANRLKSIAFGGGLNRQEYKYFADGRLDQLSFYRQGQAEAHTYHAFKYDELGREDIHQSFVNNVQDVDINRDQDDFLRATSAVIDNYGKGFTAHPGWELHGVDDYDANGRVTKFDSISTDAYDQLEKKVQVQYELKDRMSKLILETRDPTSSTMFWDTTTIDYDYDAFGSLIRTSAVHPDGGEAQTIYVPDVNGNRSLIFKGTTPELFGVAANLIDGTTVFAQRVLTEPDGSWTAGGYMIAYHDHQGTWRYGMQNIDGNNDGIGQGLSFQKTVYDADGRIQGNITNGNKFVGFVQQFKGYDYDPESSFYVREGRPFFAGLGVFLTPDYGGLARGVNNLYQRTATGPNGEYTPQTFQKDYFAREQTIWDQPEIAGAIEILGGVLELGSGVFTIVQTGGIGAFFGGTVLVAHGLDTIAAGYENLYRTGDQPVARTATYRLVKSATFGSDVAANVVDIGIGFITPAGLASTGAFTRGAINSTRFGSRIANTAGDVGYLFKHGTRAAYRSDGLLGAAGKFRSNLGQWRRGESITCFVAGTPVLVSAEQHEKYRLAEVDSDLIAATISGENDEGQTKALGFTIMGLGAIGFGLVQYQRSKLKKLDVQQLRRRQKEIDRLIYEEFGLGWVN